MRTSILLVALLFTACTDDDAVSDPGMLPGPTLAKEICAGCTDRLTLEIAGRDFQALPPNPGNDPISFVEKSPQSYDPCASEGLCEIKDSLTVQLTRADGCRVLRGELADGRLLVGLTCR